MATELSKQNNEEFDFPQMIETLNEDYTDLEEKNQALKWMKMSLKVVQMIIMALLIWQKFLI